MSRSFLSVSNVGVERAERLLVNIPNGLKKAVPRAINRAMESARTVGVQQARDQYTVKARAIRSTIKLDRANANKMIGVITSSGSPISLYDFKVNPKTVNGRRRSPIRVSVKKGQQTLLNRAFIARLGSGKTGVFERVGDKRFPIKLLFGPSAPQMLGNENVANMIEKTATETMDKRLDHEIGRLLDGAM